jgi:hypothetical protein
MIKLLLNVSDVVPIIYKPDETIAVSQSAVFPVVGKGHVFGFLLFELAQEYPASIPDPEAILIIPQQTFERQGRFCVGLPQCI